MPDKELIKAALEAATEARSLACRKNPKDNEECCCPEIVVFLIFTKCLTITNAACQDTEFCEIENDTAAQG